MTHLRDALERSRAAGGPHEAPLPEGPAASWGGPPARRPWTFDDPPATSPPAAGGEVNGQAAGGAARAPRTTRRLVRGPLVLAPVALAVGLYLLRAPGASGDLAPLRLSGLLAANEVVVAAQTAGRIEHLAVTEGTWVAAGDLVARLGREELEAERRNQAALIGQLSARLRQTRELVALEDDRSRGRVAAAEAQLRAARSQQGETSAALEQLRNDHDRAQRLFDGGLVSRQDIERLLTEVRVGEARLRSLADQASRAEADLALARAGERQPVVARRDVEQTQGQIEQARAALAQAAARLGYADVHAPLAGLVSLRVAREGEVVGMGDPIVTIVDLDDVWVRAAVDETQVHRLAAGDVLEVELASGGRVRGRVTLVEPEARFATQRDASRARRDVRTFGVKVALSNPERRLHPGMTAWLHVPAAGRAGER
jgi:multidrug resistance efflux pump